MTRWAPPNWVDEANGTVAYNGLPGLDTASLGPGHSAKPRATARASNLVVGVTSRYAARGWTGPRTTVPGPEGAWASARPRASALARQPRHRRPADAARPRPFDWSTWSSDSAARPVGGWR